MTEQEKKELLDELENVWMKNTKGVLPEKMSQPH